MLSLTPRPVTRQRVDATTAVLGSKSGLVVPSIKRRLSEHNTVRLRSYQDLLALLVVSALRTERDMSLQKIRRIVKHLRSRGYQAPLRELKFATVGREIEFQHPDGTWEGDLRPDQVVIM